MQHLINSYVHYLNIRHDRLGPLFQGRFKNVLVDSDNQLLHLSRYIHLNPLVSNLITDLNQYTWSSYPRYIFGDRDDLLEPEFILGNFKTGEDYKRFVLDQIDYTESLERLKHLILE